MQNGSLQAQQRVWLVAIRKPTADTRQRRSCMPAMPRVGRGGRGHIWVRGDSARTYLELFVRFPDRLAVCLLPPIVAVFSEEAHGPPIEQIQASACDASTADRAPGYPGAASSFEDTSGAAAPPQRHTTHTKLALTCGTRSDGCCEALALLEWRRSAVGTQEPLTEGGMHA